MAHRLNALLFMSLMVFAACNAEVNRADTGTPGDPQESGTPQPTPTASPTPAHALRNGFWGSGDARLQVKDTGARLELGCAHGDIRERILLDDHDSFKVDGTYTREGGPEPRDGRPSVPAVYEGRVTGDFAADILHLTVIVNRSSTFSFDLSYGESRLPIKCL